MLWRRKTLYLKEVSSLSSSFSSSSDPCLLCPLLRLAAREEDAGDASLDVAGEDCFERALRDMVLPLSRACLRRSCMASVAFKKNAKSYIQYVEPSARQSSKF